jgi:alpha-L-fucosidase
VVHIDYPATDRSVRPQLFNQGSRPIDRPLWTTVSKNGNFLLDIGPRADGTIPEIMLTPLREMGAWLHTDGEAIYNGTYWARGATTRTCVSLSRRTRLSTWRR